MKLGTPKQARLIRNLARECEMPLPKDLHLSVTEASRLIDGLKNTPRGWGRRDGHGPRPLVSFTTDAEQKVIDFANEHECSLAEAECEIAEAGMNAAVAQQDRDEAIRVAAIDTSDDIPF